ncbi:TIGR03086 family protein [Streptomyces albofaciens JCM 4342]|uniref:TIGR03086 family metal-binding protein n=1 Tax=Streptomyces albofaciens TaxID=66866 RepID=UPI00123B3D2E|nr:TIGR03086 family metal-binding protein [Streptomyces albofaciens]KAA6212756.1 TIGR03086 family protein [Streptomyces albofaciens JCM 4342]
MSQHEKDTNGSGKGGTGDHAVLLRRHGEAIALFGSRVHRVRAGQWDDPTPCAEWTVRDLVGHLTVEQLWVPRLVRDGATIEEVGDDYDGDRLGDDPAGAWDRAAVAAVAAFSEPGALDRTVHLSSGDSPAAAYCSQMTMDAVVHSWDLSRAIGTDERLPPELASAALREVEPYADELAATSMFADPVTPPPGADDLTRLLCLLGRRP